MKISFSKTVLQDLNTIQNRDLKLYKKVHKQLSLFKENPQHPSLRTHKLDGDLSDTWSISIERNIRMIYYIVEDTAVFFKIGTHDEVYRK